MVERGTLEEWRATRAHCGDERMKAVVTQLRSRSPRDVAFCSAAFDLQKDDSRRCTARPFPPSTLDLPITLCAHPASASHFPPTLFSASTKIN